jgi:hypothetical protein
MTEDDDEEFPGEIHPASKEEWLALTRRTPMTEAEKERAAIIQWMRGNAEAQRRHARNESFPISTRLQAEIVADRDFDVADAIERAEHLKEGR